MTPQRYLIALRLRHARFLMQQGVHSLRDIAEYCHFYDASHLGDATAGAYFHIACLSR